jgi:hypothetical protein
MKDNRTKEEKYAAWIYAVSFCQSKGWCCSGGWKFFSPSGSLHDLSAADLNMLDEIERKGSFIIK